MGHLFLVRHAQASFLSQNYDQLSARGETQARLLGSYWVQRTVVFDRVCSGPALRHRKTAELVCEAYRKAGRDFPSPSVMDEFDEFQGDAVLSQSLPELLWVNGEIAPPGLESWQDFCARVNRGLSKFLGEAGKGELGVIFTSGGPVSVALQRALHLSAQDTLRVAWMPRNCSFSEFIFSGDRFTLSSFNSFPHLDSESLHTYR